MTASGAEAAEGGGGGEDDGSLGVMKGHAIGQGAGELGTEAPTTATRPEEWRERQGGS